jgi:hypothetical protein
VKIAFVVYPDFRHKANNLLIGTWNIRHFGRVQKT